MALVSGHVGLRCFLKEARTRCGYWFQFVVSGRRRRWIRCGASCHDDQAEELSIALKLLEMVQDAQPMRRRYINYPMPASGW